MEHYSPISLSYAFLMLLFCSPYGSSQSTSTTMNERHELGSGMATHSSSLSSPASNVTYYIGWNTSTSLVTSLFAAKTHIVSCSVSAVQCPRCDGKQTTDAAKHTWSIKCNSYLRSAFGLAAFATTLDECLMMCNVRPHCMSVTYGGDHSCDMNFGPAKTVQRKGYMALQPVENAPSSRHSSTKYPTTSISAQPQRCNASFPACPMCNKKRIEDENGQSYTVHCGKRIYSERQYAVQHLLGPGDCIKECDNFNGCKGATWWPDGNCELARGEDAFPQNAPSKSYMGFLPFDPNFTPEPPQLSAFPTGDFTAVTTSSPARATSATYTPEISTTNLHSTSTRTIPSPTCNPSSIRCPNCDGFTLQDGFNSTYHVQCAFQPICDDIIGRFGYSTQNDCMEHCDLDPACLAAIYDDGHCDLCEGSMEGMATYSSPYEYVVFIAEPLLDPPKATVTSGQPPDWSANDAHSVSEVPITGSGSSSPITSSTSGISTRWASRSEQMMVNRSSTRSISSLAEPTASSQEAWNSRSGTQTTISVTTIVAPSSAPTTSSSDPSSTSGSDRLASLPVPTGDISSVSCPASNYLAVFDRTTFQYFEIVCDADFGAAQTSTLLVDNFASCAAACTSDCAGVDFAASTSCTLLTSITTVSHAPGVTGAGKIVLQ